MRFILLDIIYPTHCAACGDIIEPGQKFCKDCKSELEFIKIKQYKNKNNKFDRLISVFCYKDAAKRVVLRYKFHGKKYLYKTMAEYMFREFEENYDDINFDYITNIPMSFSEYMNRGFNQTKVLAKALSRKTKIKYKKLLRKKFSTKNQVGLTAKERAENLKGCFENTENIKGKTILLVDDVKTTGATLNECSKVLRKAGAKGIYCITFAMADE
ncbi:MAG: ComF family protein [Clostridia bacterium]|nr:ComF family protein [Clostridia bacterium]MBQ6709011.1 ComF family protein [Clostridia bacterium]